MTLLSRLQRLARRHLAIQITAGMAWAIVAAAGVLFAGAWLDLVWEMPPPARIAVLALAPAAFALCLAIMTAWALQAAGLHSLARRLDAVSASHGQILTG